MLTMISAYGEAPPPPLSTWFDISSLQTFGYNYNGDLDNDRAEELLLQLPASVTEIILETMTEQSLPRLLPMLRPWPHLLALTLRSVYLERDVIHSPLEPCLNPLALFPNLRTLTFQYAFADSILNVGHARLETLRIGFSEHYHPNDNDPDVDVDNLNWRGPEGHQHGGFSPDDPVFDISRRLRNLLTINPTLFPSLANDDLLPGCHSQYTWEKQELSFDTQATRSICGVRDMACQLDAVGIVLVDEQDTPWRPEWFHER